MAIIIRRFVLDALFVWGCFELFYTVVCGDVLQKIGDGLPATNCGM